MPRFANATVISCHYSPTIFLHFVMTIDKANFEFLYPSRFMSYPPKLSIVPCGYINV